VIEREAAGKRTKKPRRTAAPDEIGARQRIFARLKNAEAISAKAESRAQLGMKGRRCRAWIGKR
jgi:hypothetical protein